MIPKLPAVPAQLGFTEEHHLLQTSARRMLRERWDAAALRAFVESEPGSVDRADELWATMGELGYLELGAEMGALHAVLLAEELGRALPPLRWAAHHVAFLALGAEASAEERLTIHFEDDGVTLADGRISGTHRRVRGGAAATRLIAPVREGQERHWVSLALDDCTRTERSVQDPTRPLADLSHDGVAATLLVVEEEPLQAQAWLLHAAESLGATEALLQMTRAYATERQQFGRPIGTFQAVSHPIVDTMVELEQARNLVIAGAAAIDSEADIERVMRVARMAKVAADEALWAASRRAVQLHGGFGFTWECDVHFFLRRAFAARGELGSPDEHRRALAAQLLSG